MNTGNNEFIKIVPNGVWDNILNYSAIGAICILCIIGLFFLIRYIGRNFKEEKQENAKREALLRKELAETRKEQNEITSKVVDALAKNGTAIDGFQQALRENTQMIHKISLMIPNDIHSHGSGKK